MSDENAQRTAGEIELEEWTPPEAGWYSLTIKEIVEVPNSFNPGEWRYQFQSEIIGVDGAAEDFTFWAPKNYKKGARPSNLYRWVCGAVGVDAAPEVFRPSEWVDRPLRIELGHEDKFAEDGVTKVGEKVFVKGFGAPVKAQAAPAPVQADDPVGEPPLPDEVPF